MSQVPRQLATKSATGFIQSGVVPHSSSRPKVARRARPSCRPRTRMRCRLPSRRIPRRRWPPRRSERRLRREPCRRRRPAARRRLLRHLQACRGRVHHRLRQVDGPSRSSQVGVRAARGFAGVRVSHEAAHDIGRRTSARRDGRFLMSNRRADLRPLPTRRAPSPPPLPEEAGRPGRRRGRNRLATRGSPPQGRALRPPALRPRRRRPPGPPA